MTFNDRIKELRSGLSQTDFAKKFNVAPITISAIETGKQNPSWDLAIKICEEYKCSMDWLCGRSEVRNLQKEPQEDFEKMYYEESRTSRRLFEKNEGLQDQIIKMQAEMLQKTQDKSLTRIPVVLDKD